MTRENESFLAMCLKVKNFGIKNIASLGAVRAVLAFFTQCSTLISQLIAADSGSRTDLTGYAITKANNRSALEALALKVSNALSSSG